MNIAVILSGGIGERFGESLPKQYCDVNGKMIIEYVIEEANKSSVDLILIAAHEKYHYMLSRVITQKSTLISAGKNRNLTINSALEYISKKNMLCDKIVFLDAARPMIKAEEIDVVLELLKKERCVIRTEHITDTLGGISSNTYNRDEFYLVQTPEAFQFATLIDYFDVKSEKTAIYQHLPNTIKPYTFFSTNRNTKLTYKEDLPILEIMLKEKE